MNSWEHHKPYHQKNLRSWILRRAVVTRWSSQAALLAPLLSLPHIPQRSQKMKKIVETKQCKQRLEKSSRSLTSRKGLLIEDKKIVETEQSKELKKLKYYSRFLSSRKGLLIKDEQDLKHNNTNKEFKKAQPVDSITLASSHPAKVFL